MHQPGRGRKEFHLPRVVMQERHRRPRWSCHRLLRNCILVSVNERLASCPFWWELFVNNPNDFFLTEWTDRHLELSINSQCEENRHQKEILLCAKDEVRDLFCESSSTFCVLAKGIPS